MDFPWFVKELKLISSELRLVRDPGRLGFDLWIIERKLPPAIHAELLKQAEEQGLARYVDHTLDNGRVVHYDLCPEWTIGHICRDYNFDLGDPETYREPQRRDLDSVKRWLFEYRNAEEQIRQMRREREERAIQVKADGRREIARNVVLKFGKIPHTVDMGATTRFKKKGKLWLPPTSTTVSKT